MISLLNDTHFGVRSGNEIYLGEQQKFFRDVFFPYCKSAGIKEIYHLGDFFDNRKSLDLRTLHYAREYFLEPLTQSGMHMHIVPGNHDVYYKASNKITSLDIIEGPNVTVHHKPVTLGPVDLIPWITEDNREECWGYIANSKSKYLFGHFELAGFRYIGSSNRMSEGVDPSIFGKYDAVLSGHYHVKSTGLNVTYLGTQFELDWADQGEEKAFHTFDPKTGSLIAVRNPHRLHRVICFDDRTTVEKPDKSITGCLVKLIIEHSTDQKKLNKFIDNIEKLQPASLKVIDSSEHYEAVKVDGDVRVKDTSALIEDYIMNIVETDLDRSTLLTKTLSLLS